MQCSVFCSVKILRQRLSSKIFRPERLRQQLTKSKTLRLALAVCEDHLEVWPAELGEHLPANSAGRAVLTISAFGAARDRDGCKVSLAFAYSLEYRGPLCAVRRTLCRTLDIDTRVDLPA